MRLWQKLLCAVFVLQLGIVATFEEDQADSEFAEFDDFFEDENEPVISNTANEASKEIKKEIVIEVKPEIFVGDEDDGEVELEDDDSEFEHFQDIEEFEGFEEKEEKLDQEPKITIANVPLNFRQNWDSYYMEILMLSGIFIYFINFILGRNKNNKIANVWFQTHRQILEENFTLVGDDGNLDKNENVNLVKESESVYTLWCSGRTCCEGMLVELRLIKRQDLISIISGMMRPVLDQIHITVRMNPEDMDSFVFAIASKKTATHLVKDMADLSVYCPEKKPGEKFNISSNFQVMTEISEATSAMLDSKIITILNKYPEYIDYIHFSDQYSGPKPSEEATASQLKLPDTEKVLLFGFNIPVKGVPLEEGINTLKPMMNMVFYCMDKVKRYRLSKEGKIKADKNRHKVEEAFLKSTHQARAEAAAAKREEKRRQEKERVMAKDDPDVQRRWELKEEKRQAKRRAPRMKQLKVKAL